MRVDTNRARQSLSSLRENRLLGARIYVFQSIGTLPGWPRHLIRHALIDTDDGATLVPIPRALSVGSTVVAIVFAYAATGLTLGLSLATGVAVFTLVWLGTFAITRAALLRCLLDRGVLTSATNE